MIVLADHNVRGAVRAFRRVLLSPEWAEFSRALDLQFLELEDVGLNSASSDREIWTTCQAIGALLITADRTRADGLEALDEIIEELNTPTSIPVVTIGDPARPSHDPAYAEKCAIKLLDYVDLLENLKGTGRLYL
jgi:predicted nuclease of predicted toxin-antitoxin system